MDEYKVLEIFKALSNDTRLHILQWLKNPDAHFPPQGTHLPGDIDLQGGVCVGSIQEKAGISQSTISSYLDMMQRAGLLESVRHGKWTYYRRNEKTLRQLAQYVGTAL